MVQRLCLIWFSRLCCTTTLISGQPAQICISDPPFFCSHWTPSFGGSNERSGHMSVRKWGLHVHSGRHDEHQAVIMHVSGLSLSNGMRYAWVCLRVFTTLFTTCYLFLGARPVRDDGNSLCVQRRLCVPLRVFPFCLSSLRPCDACILGSVHIPDVLPTWWAMMRPKAHMGHQLLQCVSVLHEC
jgi:hypothetical protein